MALHAILTSRLSIGVQFSVSGRGINNFNYLFGKASQFQRKALCASFATTTDAGDHLSKSTKVDNADLQVLMERDHFVKLKQKIQNDQRKSMSVQDFYTLCKEEGLQQPQADRLVQSLSDSGTLLHFPNSTNTKLKDTIFLRPQDLNTAVHSLLDQNTPASLKLEADATQAEIDTLNEQLAPLKKQREDLERKANRRANVVIFSGLGYCVVQFLAIGRLTWWELSWDVMEPVTYMLTFATALIGYGFFVLTGSEYSYEGLKRNIKDRRFEALVKKTGFDEIQYQRIKRAIATKEGVLHSTLDDLYHTSVLASFKKSNPPPYTVVSPIGPTPKHSST